VTLNNHVVAMWSVIFAVYPLVSARLRNREASLSALAFSGFWTGWTLVNELPAAALAGLLLLWLLWQRPKSIVPFFVGMALPLFGFLLTNYLAIGTILPAYDKFGTPWYRYPGSHWLHPQGLDASTDSWPVYLFHLTLGHHGLFSLTPVLAVALAGMIFPTMGLTAMPAQRRVRCVLGWGTLALSLIVLGFYLYKTDSYNYGGWTSGPRWFFWLTPLWLLASLPALDRLSESRVGRGILYLALAMSALSVAYVGMNPWSHPWLFRFLEYLGWIHY
jgi:hypothetical protein